MNKISQINISENWALKQLPEDFICDAKSVAREAKSDGWLKCGKFPAQAQDVLFEHGLIEAPWLPGKAEEYQWIAERSWLYHVSFDCDVAERITYLRFGGLDTVCHVYLNGESILHADDSFIPWEVNVTGKLREKNELFLFFPSVSRLLREAELPESWEGRFSPNETIRKMRQDFVSYLGPKPRFIRVGIYGDVTVRQQGKAAVTMLRIRTELNPELTEGYVHYDFRGYAPKGTYAELSVKLGDKLYSRSTTDLQTDGEFSYQGTLTVSKPELWWPRGHGAQPLYAVEARLESTEEAPDGASRKVADNVWSVYSGAAETLDSVCRIVGFRRVVSPEPYRFLINNRHITLMGGNFAPLDSVTLCWDRERANALFNLAENAYFNVMRVWGNTGPCDDHFYDECDRRGILIWRDFNNSDMIPEDDKYAPYRLREVAYQVPHLMHRPCILLWCGGNESYLWASCGNYKPGPYVGRKTVLMMKEICRRLDPDRYFVESSPDLGAFPNDPQGGNTHGYTNMWFVPGYDYLRFATEDTRISAPGYKSLKRFMRPEDIWPADYSPLYTYPSTLPWPKSWMEYTGSISERKTGPVEEFYDAASAEELVWRLGAASGLYYRRTIEKFRQGRPGDRPDMRRNAEGYIAWKFNDSWPQLYSGKIDYFLEPYIAYYYIRRAYQPLALSFDIGSHIYAWVTNDTPEDFTGELVVGLFDMTKNVFVRELRRAVTVVAGDSLAAVRLDEFGQFERYLVLSARLYDTRGDLAAECCDFAEIERRLIFPEARLEMTVKGGVVTLTTDQFARAVELSGKCDGDEFGWVFDDNYFDLLPGEVKKVRLVKRGEHGSITAKPHYSKYSTTVTI